MELLLRAAAGATIGALIGYAAYRLVGCRSGGCPLTGNRWSAILLWGLMGVYVATTT